MPSAAVQGPMMAAGQAGRVRLAELVALLSLGTDLGLGQPMEHVIRQCLLALRLADRVGLEEAERVVLYYSGLLAWVGCHTDACEQAKWFGDDIAMKAAVIDGAGPFWALGHRAADAVLRAAGHRVRRRREWPGGMTAREVEVLRLVARGLSNKEIAQQLRITPKTASSHVEHIYAKSRPRTGPRPVSTR